MNKFLKTAIEVRFIVDAILRRNGDGNSFLENLMTPFFLKSNYTHNAREGYHPQTLVTNNVSVLSTLINGYFLTSNSSR